VAVFGCGLKSEACVFKVIYPKNTRLSSSVAQFNVDFVKREATPRLLMKLSIQLYLAESSLFNTISILEIFGVERARFTVCNWVHKADLQPTDGHGPNHVAIDKTVIRPDDKQYWLYDVLRSFHDLMGCTRASSCERCRSGNKRITPYTA
jgi:hypothetical protein